MSIADWTEVCIYIAAVAETLFVLGFGARNRWWTSLIGWSLFVKTTSLAMLLDLSVLGQILHLRIPAWVALAVVAWIAFGCCLQLLAWITEKVRKRQGRRDRLVPPQGRRG